MPQPGTIFRVLIGSPSDCPEERLAIRDAILTWNAINSETRAIVLEPVRWETHSRPELGGRPQEILNKQIVERCDVLVAVFRTRLGTHTGVAESGTVEEIGEFVKAGKPVLLYFASGLVELESVDEGQLGALREYKARIQKEGLFGTYKATGDLKEQVQLHLSTLPLLRGSGSGAIETDSFPSDAGLLQLKEEFDSFRRRVKAKWQSERDSQPASTDDGRYIIEEASEELFAFVGRKEIDEDSRLSELLEEAVKVAGQVRQHQMVLDGGKSYREFWELGDKFIDFLTQASDEIGRVIEYGDKGHSEQELSSDKIEILNLLAQDNVRHLSPPQVGERLSIRHQKARYLLEQLNNEGYLGTSLSTVAGVLYFLSGQGREYLVKRGRL